MYVCVFECTVCMWVHVHVSQLVQPSQFARGIVLLPVSLSLSQGGPSPVPTAVPHIGVPPFSSGGFLWRRLTVEALPPQALRRLPPVPAVAPTDGAVVHLHFNASWDDCGSSEAIWTCHMGEKEEILKKKEWGRAHRSLFWRECQSDSKGVSKAEQTCGCFSRACTDGLVFVTLRLFCSSFFLSFFLSNSPSHTPILSLGCFAF